jgi:hypothetical protein
MALTPEQSAEVQASMSKLRSMGCAVCIFMPEDVESCAESKDGDIAPAQAAQWLVEHRKWIEDGMSTFGNQYIDDNLAIPSS